MDAQQSYAGAESGLLEYSPAENCRSWRVAFLWLGEIAASFALGVFVHFLWRISLHRNPGTIFFSLPSILFVAALWVTWRRSYAAGAGMGIAGAFAVLWSTHSFLEAIVIP